MSSRSRPSAPRPFVPRPFRAAWWLRGAHGQTIGGKFLRPDPGIPLHRERLETPDGDFLDLDFPPSPRDDAPVVLVLHGLEGSTRRHYMLVTYRELHAHGLRAVGLNFRSCGGEPNRLPRFYHSGDTDDLRFVLGHLARRFPDAPTGAIGFSLGGNVLLKYLGEEGDAATAQVRAAAAVSVPFDLAAGAANLERGLMARIYTQYFLRNLRKKVRAKAELLRPHIDVEATLAAATLRAFDDAATAPLHGFADSADYYRRASSAGYLERIRTPTLLLHAEDDPFLPPAAIPRDAIARNPYLIAGFTRRGGHVGFVAGTPWKPRFWAEEEAARFLATHLLPPVGR
ncbi:MAG TPA: hydrolase [Longimicrobiales bacterium]